MRVLIVEDDFSSRKLLQTILNKRGECDMAVDGVEAVAAFKEALVAGKPYDLILLDIMMPKMDGQEALRRIRDIEERESIYGNSAVKIIMTTILGDYDNIMEAFSSKCESYLTKPIDGKKLLAEIQTLGLS